MGLFYVNSSTGITKTYQEFLVDLSNLREKTPYIYSNDPYEVYLKITHAILNQYQVELLDGDFSSVELENLGLDQRIVRVVEPFQSLPLSNWNQLLTYMSDDRLDFKLTLYTSGTTGRPKKIIQSLAALTRNVKISGKLSDNVWGLAYNPTHMAGLQVFFQALFNQNPLIDLFGENMKHASNLIKDYRITNISATATYYRNLLSIIHKDVFDSVHGITFGGEKFDPSLENQIRVVFPKAKIRNIYASTEAGSLFTSSGDIFSIPKQLLDKVKISSEDELWLHNSLLGLGINEEWYNSGDLVERIDINQFRFVSRQSEMINVGGYKVNPHEVEAVLTNLSFVSDALVKSRDNKLTGKIITAEVVLSKEMTESDAKRLIKEELTTKLQPFKVPRIIKIVDHIEQTRTGKKVRK